MQDIKRDLAGAVDRGLETSMSVRDAALWHAFHVRRHAVHALNNLGRCLREAGALCAAFDSGWGQGVDYVTGRRYMTPRDWQPGCGRPSPEGQ